MPPDSAEVPLTSKLLCLATRFAWGLVGFQITVPWAWISAWTYLVVHGRCHIVGERVLLVFKFFTQQIHHPHSPASPMSNLPMAAGPGQQIRLYLCNWLTSHAQAHKWLLSTQASATPMKRACALLQVLAVLWPWSQPGLGGRQLWCSAALHSHSDCRCLGVGRWAPAPRIWCLEQGYRRGYLLEGSSNTSPRQCVQQRYHACRGHTFSFDQIKVLSQRLPHLVDPLARHEPAVDLRRVDSRFMPCPQTFSPPGCQAAAC